MQALDANSKLGYRYTKPNFQSNEPEFDRGKFSRRAKMTNLY